MVMQGRIASSETNIRLLTTTTQVRREQLEVRRARLVMLELVMYAASSGYDLRKPVMVPAIVRMVMVMARVVREAWVSLGAGLGGMS